MAGRGRYKVKKRQTDKAQGAEAGVKRAAQLVRTDAGQSAAGGGNVK